MVDVRDHLTDDGNGSEGQARPSRRQVLVRGAVVAGALSVPVVLDSLTVPAAAATADFPWGGDGVNGTKPSPGTYTVYPPCNKTVNFVISGAGGGGGSANVGNGSYGGAGGKGTKITGTIPPPSGCNTQYYALTVVVGAVGKNADTSGTPDSGGAGGTKGGDAADGPNDAGASGGGGR